MKITLIPTLIQGAHILDYKVHIDDRGSFYEGYNEESFRALGLPTTWAQDNESISFANVLRGLHIQRNNPQGKLIRCTAGSIFDVFVDLRPGSPSFMKHEGVLLSWEKFQAVYIPPGCAHGYATMTTSAMVHYKCTTQYDQQSDGGIHWQSAGINWPMGKDHKPLVSSKDSALPSMDDYLKLHG